MKKKYLITKRQYDSIPSGLLDGEDLVLTKYQNGYSIHKQNSDERHFFLYSQLSGTQQVLKTFNNFRKTIFSAVSSPIAGALAEISSNDEDGFNWQRFGVYSGVFLSAFVCLQVMHDCISKSRCFKTLRQPPSIHEIAFAEVRDRTDRKISEAIGMTPRLTQTKQSHQQDEERNSAVAILSRESAIVEREAQINECINKNVTPNIREKSVSVQSASLRQIVEQSTKLIEQNVVITRSKQASAGCKNMPNKENMPCITIV